MSVTAFPAKIDSSPKPLAEPRERRMESVSTKQAGEKRTHVQMSGETKIKTAGEEECCVERKPVNFHEFNKFIQLYGDDTSKKMEDGGFKLFGSNHNIGKYQLVHFFL